MSRARYGRHGKAGRAWEAHRQAVQNSHVCMAWQGKTGSLCNAGWQVGRAIQGCKAGKFPGQGREGWLASGQGKSGRQAHMAMQEGRSRHTAKQGGRRAGEASQVGREVSGRNGKLVRQRKQGNAVRQVRTRQAGNQGKACRVAGIYNHTYVSVFHCCFLFYAAIVECGWGTVDWENKRNQRDSFSCITIHLYMGNCYYFFTGLTRHH